MEPWWRTLVEPYLKQPRTTPQPLQKVEPWRNYLKPPSQNLVKPWWNLVELSCNLALNVVQAWLVEPLSNPRPPQATPEPGPPRRTRWNLVKPLWNLTSNHPGPCRHLVEPWWTGPPPGGRVQTTPDHPAAFVEPCGTVVEPYLVEPYLRAAPEHPGPYLG